MKPLKLLICFVTGHRIDEEASNHGYYFCERCSADLSIYDSRPTLRGYWWLVKYGAFHKFCRLKRWWSPCEDCHRRFGRHDESVDHVPF